METNTAYQSYLSAMTNYQVPQGRKEYQAPYANQFEAIYNKAKEQDVKLSNAKDFLASLSQSEMQTLQKYSGLADAVNADALSSEGAYNLLMHDNEQYDFNNDGVAEVGIGKQILPVPTNMPADVRDAYITALNSLSGSDRLMATTLTLSPAHFSDTPNKQTTIDYSFLKERIENRLNPKNGGYISEEVKAATLAFWNAFDSAYTGDKTQDTAEKTDSIVEKTDSAVSQFLKDLRTKGAAQFLADLNEEKIKKMVDEYKQKLIDEMGDSPDAMQKIETMVEDFMKKFIEKMEDETKNNNKKTTPISSDSLVQQIIDMQQKKETKPLEKLLQA